MPEEHWLVKPGTVIELLELTYRQLEKRSQYLPHIVTPGGGLKLYLRSYLEELVKFIEAGAHKGSPLEEFAQTDKARSLGQQGFHQLLYLITQHASEQELLTAQAIAAILGVSVHAVLNWDLDRTAPLPQTGANPPSTYLTNTIMQSLRWHGPGLSY